MTRGERLSHVFLFPCSLWPRLLISCSIYLLLVSFFFRSNRIRSNPIPILSDQTPFQRQSLKQLLGIGFCSTAELFLAVALSVNLRLKRCLLFAFIAFHRIFSSAPRSVPKKVCKLLAAIAGIISLTKVSSTYIFQLRHER
jgi:hypothetical protein